MPLELFDSHNHLYLDEYDADRDAVIERAREAGVVGMVCVAENIETARACIELAQPGSRCRLQPASLLATGFSRWFAAPIEISLSPLQRASRPRGFSHRVEKNDRGALAPNAD